MKRKKSSTPIQITRREAKYLVEMLGSELDGESNLCSKADTYEATIEAWKKERRADWIRGATKYGYFGADLNDPENAKREATARWADLDRAASMLERILPLLNSRKAVAA